MNGSIKSILFYPDLPHPRTIIGKLCDSLSIEVTNIRKTEHTVCFKWRDHTAHTFTEVERGSLGGLKIFNEKCVDISKRRIHEVHEGVMGYPLEVDPRAWRGPMVVKSNRNAAHDGSVVEGPIDVPCADKVYSRVIDNVEGSEVVDFRAVVIGGTLELVYVKRRPRETRFSNRNSSVSFCSPEVLFSKEELIKILAFAEALGLDCGELDVLRDKESRLLYIVDAANTPYGPPNGLPQTDQEKVLGLLSTAFGNLLNS